MWVKDLRTLGYPAHLTANFSKTFGKPATKLAFADQEHLVITFISADSDAPPSEQEGRPDSFRLRLHIVVLEKKSGEVDAKLDFPGSGGVIAGHDGKVVVRSGNKLTLYDMTLKVLKETDTKTPFADYSSPSGRFLLLEFSQGVHAQFRWINSDTLETLHSFSDSISSQTISETEVVGWRIPLGRPSDLVIRTPEDAGHAINLKGLGAGSVAFVNDDALAIASGYSPIQLIRRDGTLIESITPRAHDFLSRITPSAEGNRFAFTGSTIRNRSEILTPHQTWEYVQRVNVYDISTHTFVADIKVNHSARNEDFPLALAPNGSMLAFLDGEILELYRLPPAAEANR
ncbi:MAG: hypothetical protein WCD49_18515 [Candidatus Acidiferrales bacterium]